MMKRFALLVLSLLLLSPLAAAEHQDASKLPYALKKALRSSVFAKDEVIDFLVHDGYLSSALVAVKHEGKTVLVGYQQDPFSNWHQSVLSETLLPDDGDFSLAYHLHGDKDTLCVVRGDASLCFMPMFDANCPWLPYVYHCGAEDGSVWQLGLYALPDNLPYFTFDASGECVENGTLPLKLPVDPALLSFDMMPNSASDAAVRVPLMQLPDDKKYGVCDGCNFRMMPDVRSTSKGYYNAGTVVEMLGVRMFNWVMVKIGNETGWMHVDYVKPADYYGGYVLPCAYTPDGTMLYSALGEEIAFLDENTAMHVLGSTFSSTLQMDSLHVCIPQGEIESGMDVNGVYGYVNSESVSRYIDALNLQYALEKPQETLN